MTEFFISLIFTLIINTLMLFKKHLGNNSESGFDPLYTPDLFAQLQALGSTFFLTSQLSWRRSPVFITVRQRSAVFLAVVRRATADWDQICATFVC